MSGQNAREAVLEELGGGIHAFVRTDCATCRLVAPVLASLERAAGVRIYTQEDPDFPEGCHPVDETALRRSYLLDIEVVPTLLVVRDGAVVERFEGWERGAWERITGRSGLGEGLPPFKPGCGSRSLDPGVPERLAVEYGGERTRSRRIEVAALEDELEVCFRRGWTDGLPVVPPTPARVLRMLAGTTRDPAEVVARVPPDLVECSIEKVAINAVMAGCLPEYLPVVLAAVEAACTDEFNMHGLLATTHFSGPMVVVNGPIAARIGMNSGVNALGQGNRANSTIGRALQLVVRNVGGGRPGEIDRATLGNPGKVGFCFAEDEAGSPWEPLSVARGVAPGRSAVTLFAASGVTGVVDQRSRTPEGLARTFAEQLLMVGHRKHVLSWDAALVVAPEHARVFRAAGWSRQRLLEELTRLTTRPAAELREGADGHAEGIPAGLARGLPEDLAGVSLPKFRPGGLLLVHAGGTAGMFSAIIGGWVSGAAGSQPVTREIGS